MLVKLNDSSAVSQVYEGVVSISSPQNKWEIFFAHSSSKNNSWK